MFRLLLRVRNEELGHTWGARSARLPQAENATAPGVICFLTTWCRGTRQSFARPQKRFLARLLKARCVARMPRPGRDRDARVPAGSWPTRALGDPGAPLLPCGPL